MHVIDFGLGVFVFRVFLLRLFLLGIVFGLIVVRRGLGCSLKEGLRTKETNEEKNSEGHKHNATHLRA